MNSFTAPYFWRETSLNNQKLKAKHCKRNLSPTILTGNRQGKLFPDFASHRLITHSCYHSEHLLWGSALTCEKGMLSSRSTCLRGDSPSASFVLE